MIYQAGMNPRYTENSESEIRFNQFQEFQKKGFIMEEFIFKYTRQDALNDGVLVDISDLAKEAGYKYPVAVTSRLHEALMDIPDEFGHEGYKARLWDVLSMCRVYTNKTKGDTVLFKVILHTSDNKTDDLITLKAMCHPGDNGEPVVTMAF